MNLTSVYKRHDAAAILWRLLSERSSTENISHVKMPSWDEHKEFINSLPYEAWYFIGDEPVGACYLTRQNEIGVFIFKAHQGNGYGVDAILELMKLHGHRRYLANVNPKNERSAGLFNKLGFKHIQQTYEFRA